MESDVAKEQDANGERETQKERDTNEDTLRWKKYRKTDKQREKH